MNDAMERARQLIAAAGGEGPQADVLPKTTANVSMDRQNPAERPGRSSAERQRIPMSVPLQRLQVPDIPGWHLHWFRGTPERIARAQQGGYEFVTPEEVDLNNLDIGGSSAVSGNTDMGSRVSVISGEEVGRDSQPVSMILMKIREELWLEDQGALEDRQEQIATAIRGGKVGVGQAPGENASDAAQRYVRQTENLFTRKRKR